LYWNYPQRTLQVDIPEKGRSFTVCIGYVNDPFVKRGRYTTSKESRLFDLPRKQGTVLMHVFEINLLFMSHENLFIQS